MNPNPPSLLRRVWRERQPLAGAALYWSGLSALYRALARPRGAVMLMYHSVADASAAAFIDPANRLSPEAFEAQMVFLARHRHVVSLAELVAQLERGQTPRQGTVCITFDDGYLDNLTVAAPILKRLGLSATLFLPTAYIDHAQAQWVDEIHYLFKYRRQHRLVLDALGLQANLQNPHELQRARHALHPHLLEGSFETRQALLASVREQLQPQTPMPRLTMNWDDVRALQALHPGFEIGGHSRHHLDLRTHGGAVALDEVQGCAQDIQRALGAAAPRFFSFPYGRWSPETQALVRQAPWQAAIGASPEFLIHARSDRFVLARPETPLSMTALRFQTSGAYPGMLALLGLK